MPQRVAMEVLVQWLTLDDAEGVKEVYEALDEAGFPGPTDWVSEAIHVGARQIDPRITRAAGVSFDIVTKGPATWSEVVKPKDE